MRGAHLANKKFALLTDPNSPFKPHMQMLNNKKFNALVKQYTQKTTKDAMVTIS